MFINNLLLLTKHVYKIQQFYKLNRNKFGLRVRVMISTDWKCLFETHSSALINLEPFVELSSQEYSEMYVLCNGLISTALRDS